MSDTRLMRSPDNHTKNDHNEKITEGNKFMECNICDESRKRIEEQMLALCSDTDYKNTGKVYEKALILDSTKETSINLHNASEPLNQKPPSNIKLGLNIECPPDHNTATYVSNQTCCTKAQQPYDASLESVHGSGRNFSDESNGDLETHSSKQREIAWDAISPNDLSPAAGNVSETKHRGEIPALDICQNHWQYQDLITEKGCVFQRERSDVKLTIQRNSIETDTTISSSILLDIPFLRRMFKLQKTHLIVAPAVEYHLHEVSHLKLHACLELPHCMGGRNVKKMQVWCCTNTIHGNIIMERIHFIEKPSDGYQNLDIYWTKSTKRNTVNVYAKHFCVILCTACQEDVEFDIRAWLFHKFGDIDPLPLTLHLHLGGPLSKIKDFEKATMEMMEKKAMIFIEETNLNLIPRLQGALTFQLEVLEISRGQWEHAKRQNGNLVYESQKNINVGWIARCGNEHVINYEVKWLLQRMTVSTNICSFCADVIHEAREIDGTATTTMNADLRVPEDRQHIGNIQVQYNQDSPKRKIIELLMVGLRGKDIHIYRELFRAFGIPFHEECVPREDYWHHAFGPLILSRGLDFFVSELGSCLSTLGLTDLLEEVRTCLPRDNSQNAQYYGLASGPRNDSNLPFLQPSSGISYQAMPNMAD